MGLDLRISRYLCRDAERNDINVREPHGYAHVRLSNQITEISIITLIRSPYKFRTYVITLKVYEIKWCWMLSQTASKQTLIRYVILT
jgi:hypothetical protein